MFLDVLCHDDDDGTGGVITMMMMIDDHEKLRSIDRLGLVDYKQNTDLKGSRHPFAHYKLRMESTEGSNNLKDKLKKKLLQEKAKSGATTRSCHVRIDNFQRPVQKSALVGWLSEQCGTELVEDNVWLSKFHSHCYVDFKDEEAADNCILKVAGQIYPATSSNPPLVAHFTTVSAVEAPNSSEASLRLDEWKAQQSSSTSVLGKRKAEDAESEPTDQSSKRSNNEKTTPKVTGGSLFMKATEGALRDAAGAQQKGLKQKVGGREVVVLAGGAEGNAKGKSSAKKIRVATPISASFRITSAKPALFWCPASDEVVRNRQEPSQPEQPADVAAAEQS